jgi:2Fe-2S ferredoxin
MPQISFSKNKPAIHVESGANLMQSLLSAQLPVASSCHGEGVCSKCHIRIVDGKENISAETTLEKNLKAKNKINPEHRISCQTLVLGPITVDATYW